MSILNEVDPFYCNLKSIPVHILIFVALVDPCPHIPNPNRSIPGAGGQHT